MFDIMVTASIAAIPLSACQYREFIVPLILICVLGAVAIYYYLEFLTKRIFFDYPHEAFLSLYGMLTGTANTGAVLLHYNTVDIEQSLLLDAVYIHDGEILPAHITIFVYTLNVITVLTILLKQHFASAADETGGKPEVYAW